MDAYDIIIAGGGCAGLSLALHLQEAGVLAGRRTLVVDRAPKAENDRTWCFWGNPQTPFAHLAIQQWTSMNFYCPEGEVHEKLDPYTYYLLRGIDFYRYARERLKDDGNIEWRYGDIRSFHPRKNGAELVVDGDTISCTYLFNSCVHLVRPMSPAGTEAHFLWQHFKGWTVESPDPVFQPDTATLMDFRMPQAGEVRFGYVLPFSPNEALVEFTAFAPETWPDEAYDPALREYLQQGLGVSAYSVKETEQGAIPMTDRQFARQSGDHVFHIGTAGGDVKPTTGYAFQRIQEVTRHIARHWRSRGYPRAPVPSPRRFAFYDTLLLHILEREGQWGRPIFSRLFRKNRIPLIMKFLAERTNPIEEAKIFASLPFKPFLQAVWENWGYKGQTNPFLPKQAKAFK